MTTKRQRYYEDLLDSNMRKLILEDNPWILNNGPYKRELDASRPAVDFLIAHYMDIGDANIAKINDYIIKSIQNAASHYGDKNYGAGFFRIFLLTRHTGLVQYIAGDIKYQIPKRELKSHLKYYIELGVVGRRCNPTGNYADLCRAIVSRFTHVEGWDFSGEFNSALGLEPVREAPRP